MAHSVVAIMYFGERMLHSGKLIIPYTEPYDGWFDPNPSTRDLFFWSMTNTIILTFGTLKILQFMRINETFVKLISTLD